MGHPVGGPLRTLALSFREVTNGSTDAAFRLARRALRSLNRGGFIIRKSNGAPETEAELESIEAVADAVAEALVAAQLAPLPEPEPEPVAQAEPEPEPEPDLGPTQCAVETLDATAGDSRLIHVPGHEWTWRLSGIGCSVCGPLLGANAPDETRQVLDLERIAAIALDAHDALNDRRPDLATQDVADLLTFLGVET